MEKLSACFSKQHFPTLSALEETGAGGTAYKENNHLPVWDLSDLYNGMDDAKVEKDLTWVQEEAEKLQNSCKEKLVTLSGSELARAISVYESITQVLNRLGTYASLLYHQKATDPIRAKFMGDTQNRIVNMTRCLVFFTLELADLDTDHVQELCSKSPELTRYLPWLANVQKMKPYRLSKELESYLHDNSVVSESAWIRMYDESWARMTFEIDGKTLSLEATLDFLSNPNREMRRKAAAALSKCFKENIEFYTLIMNTLTKMKSIEDDQWRKFSTPQTPRHLANDVEEHVVTALKDSTLCACPKLSHRYYKLKAKWLGLDKLQFWDRNAPLSEEDESLFSWDEAKDIVLESYSDFHPDMGAIAKRFFDNNWIDAPVSEGKSPGAFSHPCSTDTHPFIMLNYLGKPRDVMTLAHELGHGIHQSLAAPQGELLASTPLTLAETASVFGEMLTFKKLKDIVTDPHKKRLLIANKIEDMINTAIRQVAFYDFECKIHKKRVNSEMTSKDIGNIWMSVQRKTLGDSFDFSTDYADYWCYVQHFIHVPFYVYAYAFGFGLVTALYALYEKGDPEFYDKYVEMMKAGGSKHHSKLLAPFGLNASKPEFWDLGLGVIDTMITELEEML
jgi:oligoendopeptidase F